MTDPFPRVHAPGLYLHIPFCRAKCAYCDFLSGPFPRDVQAAYLTAVEEELRRRRDDLPRPYETIYVGGGSPSSLDGRQWDRLLAILAGVRDAAACIECTVEMNPSQVTAQKLAGLAGLATRISLGVQTFSPTLRRTLGRVPEDPGPIEGVAAAIRERFHLNLDLIHSIPGQTPAMLEDDLRRAAGLGPDHVSAYALTLEEETPLAGAVARGAVAMPDEDAQADMLALVRRGLGEGGYRQYEISNFAHPGRECLHNWAVWAGEAYLGVGASACSHAHGERTRNEADVLRYIERIRRGGVAIAERERLDARGRAGELAMLALRTRAGIPIASFRARTGLDPLVLFADAIHSNEAAGLLVRKATHVRLTEAGLDLADRVMADFLAE